jgi:hypothetical protein
MIEFERALDAELEKKWWRYQFWLGYDAAMAGLISPCNDGVIRDGWSHGALEYTGVFQAHATAAKGTTEATCLEIP